MAKNEDTVNKNEFCEINNEREHSYNFNKVKKEKTDECSTEELKHDENFLTDCQKDSINQNEKEIKNEKLSSEDKQDEVISHGSQLKPPSRSKLIHEDVEPNEDLIANTQKDDSKETEKEVKKEKLNGEIKRNDNFSHEPQLESISQPNNSIENISSTEIMALTKKNKQSDKTQDGSEKKQNLSTTLSTSKQCSQVEKLTKQTEFFWKDESNFLKKNKNPIAKSFLSNRMKSDDGDLLLEEDQDKKASIVSLENLCNSETEVLNMMNNFELDETNLISYIKYLTSEWLTLELTLNSPHLILLLNEVILLICDVKEFLMADVLKDRLESYFLKSHSQSLFQAYHEAFVQYNNLSNYVINGQEGSVELRKKDSPEAETQKELMSSWNEIFEGCKVREKKWFPFKPSLAQNKPTKKKNTTTICKVEGKRKESKKNKKNCNSDKDSEVSISATTCNAQEKDKEQSAVKLESAGEEKDGDITKDCTKEGMKRVDDDHNDCINDRKKNEKESVSTKECGIKKEETSKRSSNLPKRKCTKSHDTKVIKKFCSPFLSKK